MNVKKRVSRRSLTSDLKQVDAHVIAPQEYDELPELTEDMLDRAKLNKGGRPVTESPRVLRRLQTLRRWSHEQEIKSFFTRNARTRCTHGAGTPGRVPIPVGGH